jgi:hypothetical protein
MEAIKMANAAKIAYHPQTRRLRVPFKVRALSLEISINNSHTYVRASFSAARPARVAV